MNIRSWVKINTNSVCLNGNEILTETSGKELLIGLYRKYLKDYPKFFKMDTLCRLGTVACELLLDNIKGDNYKEDISIILFNKSASLANDKIYQKTIVEDNYFPSPSVFVYTLANIVTGEIAIRHKIYGETSFYILNTIDIQQIHEIVTSTLTGKDNKCICGWLECSSDNSFDAILFLFDGSNNNHFNIENINRIINF